jgi:hypothetical protein
MVLRSCAFNIRFCRITDRWSLIDHHYFRLPVDFVACVPALPTPPCDAVSGPK